MSSKGAMMLEDTPDTRLSRCCRIVVIEGGAGARWPCLPTHMFQLDTRREHGAKGETKCWRATILAAAVRERERV